MLDAGLYKEYIFNQGIYKYVPNKLLLKLQKNIKPRIVCEYTSKSKNKTLGYGIGISLSRESMSEEKYIKKIIESIKKLKNDNTRYIILDGVKDIDNDHIRIIEEETNLRIPNGRDIFLKFITKVLNDIYVEKQDTIQNQDIIVISDGTEDAKNIIIQLAQHVKFIVVRENDMTISKNLEEEVMNKTGLSIYCTNNINKFLPNTNIVVNLSNESINNIDISKMRQNTIIIDSSRNKEFSNNIFKLRKDLLIINDIIVKNENDIMSNVKEFNFAKELDTSISKVINNSINNLTMSKVKTYSGIVTIKEAIKLYKLSNLNVSVFNRKLE
ncbi:hypothetical protein CLPU_12c01010 [Gottschalkia purinilytica]|uniref:Uncharacterized protein n=1 Tax=Gottschalkia purinilytica TaxID=1503 RepID=A0A0L0W8C8_GOTPU|nr:hypothetical protein [Gottschalkia purinilytica]KNF07828.1 hypothetical protein CLPU_12c01010 [Gottschalkia purinilytica]